jgi:cytosine/adenosine deaminase-related metal-dependent hydrolase
MLYCHATVITVNSDREILLDGAILVRGDRIVDVGKADVLIDLYPSEDVKDLTGRIIIPGLVNTHMHTAQTLLRGR